MQQIIEYKNFGKCVQFEENGMIVMVTIDVGPRIIYFGNKKNNILKEDLERKVQVYNDAYKDNWYLYGGHRLWKSPENICTYVADNKPVSYRLNEYGGRFISNIDPKFDYILDIGIKKNNVYIENTIVSKSKNIESIAAWALTVMDIGGELTVNLNKKMDDLNPQQNLVIWPYTDIYDERIKISKEKLIIQQKSGLEPLKLGLFLNTPEAEYSLKGIRFKCKFKEENTTGKYGDFMSNMEIYTSGDILEIEGLSSMRDLKGGESVTLYEEWSLIN